MSNVLVDLSNQFAEVVKSAGQSVVRVEGRRRIPASGIVWSADGLIITASHVVARDEGIRVGLADGNSLDAALVGRDPSTDLAVLRVDATLTPLAEANKQDVAVGNLVLALARPGRSVQVAWGIISALGDSWRTGGGGIIDRYVQTDLVMYPGFSGGPLVGADGSLLGLNTSALARGVSVAAPTMTLARVADTLLAHGRIRRGYLGVSTQRVHLPEALRGTVGQKRGLLVVSVETDSPAEKGGLTLGDTIVAVAGIAVQNHDDLLAALSGDKIGTAVPLTILRGGQVQTQEVVVGERP
ncbi:MAG: PDZ domain-containing protein [Chloroflexi bacterium]|nr:trypsin-like peptidase domain-containing protein [Ardenticatenaceae bacterium]MBL1127240.1 PDZ domain-containing protein [Chloroflexota bacterium]NOG33302.1 PDZ domain-containing protein [Chloroflexota bacterium]GIK56124.1 MAG: serine protease [Chloroflexota bacterium]